MKPLNKVILFLFVLILFLFLTYSTIESADLTGTGIPANQHFEKTITLDDISSGGALHDL